METKQPTLEEQEQLNRYHRACHAVQSGVKFEQERGSSDGSPKHLRTGINVAMCDHAALVRLLISKGIITDLEYFTAIADEAEKEKERYEVRASAATGMKITFG